MLQKTIVYDTPERAVEPIAFIFIQRRQFQNRQKAMEKLQEKLAGLQQEEQAKQVHAAWREHTRIVRGNPVRTYEGEKFHLKK